MTRGMMVLLVVLGLGLTLSACGKKGTPEPPPGSTYPREYPSK